MQVEITPGPRTWYGRRTYAVTVSDPTGNLTFHGCSRKGAAALERMAESLIGERPVGAVADLLARKVFGRVPSVGEEWTARL